MRILTIAAALAGVGATGPAAAADLSGNYLVQGSCPAPNSAYRGTLRIDSHGLFHTLTWRIGPDTIVGTGLEHDGRMVIEFRFANGTTGLMDMVRSGATWHGGWAVTNVNIYCSEAWTPA
jgi:hypothetical protein